MHQVTEFIEAAGGRNVVAKKCKLSTEAVRIWCVNNEIPRDHLLRLEKLSRDRRCFRAFKRAAVARGEYSCGAEDRRGNTRTFGNIDAAKKVADKLNGKEKCNTD